MFAAAWAVLSGCGSIVGGALRVVGTWILDLISGWPFKAYAVSMVLIGGTWLLGHHIGWNGGYGAREAEEQAKAAPVVQAGRVFVSSLTAADNAAKIDLGLKTANINLTFKIIDKEIARHVTPDIDRRYPLPCGLIRVWDAGSLRADPAALASRECPSDAAAAPTKASALSQASTHLWRVYWLTVADDRAVRTLYTNLATAYEKLRQDYITINKGAK